MLLSSFLFVVFLTFFSKWYSYFTAIDIPSRSVKTYTLRFLYCFSFVALFFHLLTLCCWFQYYRCFTFRFMIYRSVLLWYNWLVLFMFKSLLVNTYAINIRLFTVLNATFNNISFISWRSVLLLQETGEPGENHRVVASHCQTLSHNVVSNTPRLSGIQTHNVNGDNHWLHSYKSNYHAITATTAPINIRTLIFHKETILNTTLFGSMHVYKYILLFWKQLYCIWLSGKVTWLWFTLITT